MPRDDDNEAFFDAAARMSKSARDRWNRQRRERAEAILADLESGRFRQILMRDIRQKVADLDDGQELDRAARELINTLHSLRNEDSVTTPNPEIEDPSPAIEATCPNCGYEITIPLGAASAEPGTEGPGIQPGMESGPGMPQPQPGDGSYAAGLNPQQGPVARAQAKKEFQARLEERFRH